MKKSDLDDLKQFILATISQSESRLSNRIDDLEKRMDSGFAAVYRKMDAGFAAVGDAFDITHEIIDKNQKTTNRRLTRLEARTF